VEIVEHPTKIPTRRNRSAAIQLSPPCSGLRDQPSPPGEGDQDQRWSDLGCVARFRFCFLFFSFFQLTFSFLLFVSTRSDGSKSPPSPPPPPSPTFRFTPPPSDLVLYGGDLLEILGDLNLLRHLSFLSARSCHSGGRRDLLRQLMFGVHQIWGFLPVRSLIDPIFGVVYLKLFLKSPHHARIAWHLLPWQTRFDLVVYLTGITAPDLLLLRTLVVVVVLVLFRTMVKCCVDGFFCCCTVCVCCCWCSCS
jgi:hypothetical protein